MTSRDGIEGGELVEPLHYEPVSGRELRAQSIQRLQIGLLGLCAMLLIIGLANIIMDKAKGTEAQDDPIGEVIAKDAPQSTKKGIDPLADIGVVPAADPAPDLKPSAMPEPVLEP